jgi:hypothetical protein
MLSVGVTGRWLSAMVYLDPEYSESNKYDEVLGPFELVPL